MQALRRNRLTMAVNLSLLLLPGFAAAQEAATPAPTAPAEAKTLDRIEVTGSRIKQTNRVTSQPVAIITREQIDASGATSIGDYLQELTASGKSLNAKFNSSGAGGAPFGGTLEGHQHGQPNEHPAEPYEDHGPLGALLLPSQEQR